MVDQANQRVKRALSVALLQAELGATNAEIIRRTGMDPGELKAALADLKTVASAIGTTPAG